MSDEWIKNYTEIKEFIASHPEIEIEPIMVSIPADVRPEFYRLFDAVRLSYLKANFPGMLTAAKTLSVSFSEVQKEVVGRLNLKKIELESNTKSFLQDPGTGLSSGMFNPLFDLLKGKTDVASFDRNCAAVIRNDFKRHFHYGYEFWAALSLICLLEPDKAYSVPVHDQNLDVEILSAESRPGGVEEVNDVVISETISLDTSRVTPYLVPTVILHSPVLQTFAAIRADEHEVFRGARILSKGIDWLKKEPLGAQFGRHNLWPDIGLYLHDEVADLRVTLDYLNIAHPDIVLNVMEGLDWYEAGKLNIVKLQSRALKPRLGSFVICRETVPEAAIKEIQSDFEAEQDLIAKQIEVGTPPGKMQQASPPIYLLDVGYDRSKLEPVIGAVVKSRTKS